jgi:hypothetical protein
VNGGNNIVAILSGAAGFTSVSRAALLDMGFFPYIIESSKLIDNSIYPFHAKYAPSFYLVDASSVNLEQVWTALAEFKSGESKELVRKRYRGKVKQSTYSKPKVVLYTLIRGHESLFPFADKVISGRICTELVYEGMRGINEELNNPVKMHQRKKRVKPKKFLCFDVPQFNVV